MTRPPTQLPPRPHQAQPAAVRLPSRAGRVLGGLAATIGLLAVTAGIPIILLVVAGPPIPGRVPTLEEVKTALLTRDDGQLFLTTLGYLAWACWALLLLTVVVEVVAQLRGRATPRLTGLGWAQWLAHAMVTGVTALAVAVPSLARTTAPPPPLPAATATAPAVPGTQTSAETDAGAQAAAVHETAGEHTNAGHPDTRPPAPAHPQVQPAGHTKARQKTYTVQRRDTLWGIAERLLGNGERYREIAELNYGRSQPDGGHLTSAHWIHPGWQLLLPNDANTPDRHDNRRWYTVKDGDTLTRIAARELGDETRHPDIFALNHHRTQPDGSRLTDPNHIRAGWRLLLPTTQTDSAKPPPHPDKPTDQDRTPPPARPTAPPATSSPATPHPPPSTTQPPASQHPSPTASPSASAQSSGSASSPHAPTATQTPTVDHERRAISLPSGALISGSLAGAIAAAIVLIRLHRRHRYRAGTDPLAAPPGPERRPTPRHVRRAYLAEQPEDTTATETAVTTEQPAPLVDPANPPLTALPIADRDGHEILVAVHDLDGLALTGPGAHDAARAILTTLVATGGLHTAHVLIPETDLRHLLDQEPTDTTPLHVPSAITVTPTLSAALQHLETEITGRTRLLDSYDCPDLETFRHNHPDEDPLPPTILLASVPERAQPRLTAILTLGKRHHLGAIVLGAWPTGTTCHVTADGRAAEVTGPGSETLQHSQLFHLPATDTADLLAVLAAATGADEPTPPEAGEEPQPDASTPRDDAHALATADVPDPPSADPTVRLTVLGPVRLYVDGNELATGLRDRAREILAYLAAHPEGATLDRILAELWPDTDPDPAAKQFHTAATNIRRVLRTATDTPKAQFVVHTNGRYQLDPDTIDVDLWRYRHHLHRANTDTTDGDTVRALTDATKTYQADFLDDRTYEWTEPIRENLHRTAIDACTRLATHHEDAGDAEQALAVLDHAITLDPHNEDLYQRSIQLLATLDRTATLRLLYHKLRNHLNDIDTEPAPATERLVAEHLARQAAIAKASSQRVPGRDSP